MEKPTTVAPPAGAAPDGGRSRPRRSAADWAGLVVFAAVVMIVGACVGVLGPLFAIACTACQDGVRSPLRFEGALTAVAAYAVPVTTFGTVLGMLLPRGGARVGAAGIGVLVMLLFVILGLGRFSA
jgi:hypothetical protein